MVHETHCVSRIKTKQYYGIIHNTVMYLKTYQDMSTLPNVYIIAGPLLAVHTVIVQVRHEWVASPSEIQTMGEPNDFISKL